MYKFIDPAMVKSRVDEWGGKDMVIDIVGMLDESFHENLGKINQAVSTLDFKQIKELVHPLKSNFYYFFDRNTEFGVIIQDFENKGKNEDPSNLDEYYNIFEKNGKLTLEELKEFVSNL